MKHLVIYCHPNPKSFNHAIQETFVNALKQKGHDLRLRDLYELNFDPILKPNDFILLKQGKTSDDVATEQEQIKWAEIITFIFPVWWTGLPAVVKGYIDRVLSFGFAYKIDKDGVKGLLADKKVFILNTTGTPENIYNQSGMFKSLIQTMDQGIFEFCGIKVLGHKFFTGVPSVTEQDRKNMLEEVKKIASQLK